MPSGQTNTWRWPKISVSVTLMRLQRIMPTSSSQTGKLIVRYERNSITPRLRPLVGKIWQRSRCLLGRDAAYREVACVSVLTFVWGRGSVTSFYPCARKDACWATVAAPNSIYLGNLKCN